MKDKSQFNDRKLMFTEEKTIRKYIFLVKVILSRDLKPIFQLLLFLKVYSFHLSGMKYVTTMHTKSA